MGDEAQTLEYWPDVFNRVPVYVREIDSYNLLNVRDVRQKKE